MEDYGNESCTPAKGEPLELGAGSRWFSAVVRRRILRGVCTRPLLSCDSFTHLCDRTLTSGGADSLPTHGSRRPRQFWCLVYLSNWRGTSFWTGRPDARLAR
jgi:hypothetical protein